MSRPVRSATPTSGRSRRAARARSAPFFAIAALLAAPVLLRTATNAPPAIGSLEACTDGEAELVVVVLDVSSSVIDSGGADPDGRSFDESVRVAELMRDTPCSADDRFGAIIFANSAVEIPPVLVSSHSVIAAALVRPPAEEIGGGTRIAPALSRVGDVLARHPNHRTSVIVLSDMRDESDLTAILEDMADASGLHLIALGDHDARFDAHFDSVTPLTAVSAGGVGAALVDLINQERSA